MGGSREVLERELERCSWDFPYFAKRYLKIRNKHGKLVPFVLNKVQREVWEDYRSRRAIFMLKSRQLGGTTLVAGINTWKMTFRPGFVADVVAHKEKTVRENIAPIYKRFYQNLPDWMRPEKVSLTTERIEVSHGVKPDGTTRPNSKVTFSTASTDAARGSTPSDLHLSEFAFYDDPEGTVGALLAALPSDARVFLETTANGMNYAHKLWNSDSNSYHKVFFPWSDDADYRSDKPFADGDIPEELRGDIDEFDLDREQVSWMIQTYSRLHGDLRLMRQEYPLCPSHAFQASGGRFFRRAFGLSAAPAPGYMIWEEPRKYAAYVMGVDVASGDRDGDFSTFVVADFSDPTKVRTVAAFYQRMPLREFAKRVVVEAKKWQALAVVEVNSFGLTVVEELRLANYPHIYYEMDQRDGEHAWSRKYGFSTKRNSRPLVMSKLYEAVESGYYDCRPGWFQFEADRFAYNGRGKPEAQHGFHDDMVMATGFMIYGSQQVPMAGLRDAVLSQAPSNIDETLQFEQVTGKVWGEDEGGEVHTYPSAGMW